ncbi:Segregation and condensation protein B [hydrothermal vent metagenome]|uniref:Segregation and condensation protein B n=1 Tax=hydrothermal vent metagenome TaxID=652676 RepID=A0A3B0XS48_9ZZZZ
MQIEQLKNILEAILLTADQPMDMRKLGALFEADEERPTSDSILQALQNLQADYQGRGIELKEVASGYRMQVNTECATWVARMWEEKPPRYSRALLETLVLIAYRQPITRGEIEEIRGVSVSSHIIKTLSEREWVRVLGHKDVPGRPSMYGTTRDFLDYFNLKNLDELPSLADITDLDKLHPELAFDQEVAAAGETDENSENKAEISINPDDGSEQGVSNEADKEAEEPADTDLRAEVPGESVNEEPVSEAEENAENRQKIPPDAASEKTEEPVTE